MENQAEEKKCRQCGADLLPGLPPGNRIFTIIMGVILALPLWVPAVLIMGQSRVTSGKVPEETTHILLFLFICGGLLFLWALYRALRTLPEGIRYRLRADRHARSDPAQAFADYTRAVERMPGDTLAWKARHTLIPRLNLGDKAVGHASVGIGEGGCLLSRL
jgi:hypothetical protein